MIKQICAAEAVVLIVQLRYPYRYRHPGGGMLYDVLIRTFRTLLLGATQEIVLSGL